MTHEPRDASGLTARYEIRVRGELDTAWSDWFAGPVVLLYDVVLYRTALVPRWLSGWGIAAAVAMLVAAMLAMFGIAPPLSPVHISLNLPIAVQEMALAVWLIARGFAPGSVAAAPSAQAAALAGAGAR